ncbi:hypothetical protein BO71DRAFT_84291 [Aspergillus ellipticus CBS 707.79]|uniref:Uncharacterized protein n=1 Tax=Aspergillus ellipticus CBS 707.79 TaxID=1448320 RepID=A0A319DQR2_9EURO|nr:hypothetical protein BO71DRAFT_84291 [Aspergillus ellipticus CBS 707.79]
MNTGQAIIFHCQSIHVSAIWRKRTVKDLWLFFYNQMRGLYLCPVNKPFRCPSLCSWHLFCSTLAFETRVILPGWYRTTYLSVPCDYLTQYSRQQDRQKSGFQSPIALS